MCRESRGVKEAGNRDTEGVEDEWGWSLSPADWESGKALQSSVVSGFRGRAPAAKAFRRIFNCENASRGSE